MWDHMHGYGFGVMGYGWIFGLIIWLLLIIGIVLAIKWSLASSGGGGKSLSAMDILKQRYASGEITEEEYHKMKKEIQAKE